ncbi:MAG: hypothetical protein ACQETH_15520, partial [Candidatus Rifleibacteriota bacterium]
IVVFSVLEVTGDQKMVVKGDLQKRFEFLAQVKEPEVEILANGKPINDQEFYQGQKVDLTYKVSLPDQGMGLRGVKWSFEGDLPLSKIKYNDLIKKSENLLFDYKVVPLKENDLEQPLLEIFLFDYVPNKSAVVGTFSFAIANEQPREKGFTITYSKVRVEDFKPVESAKEVSVIEVSEGKWAIGFPYMNGSGSPPVFEAEASFKNETSIEYIVGGFQLVKVEAIRSFINEEKHVRKQFFKTIDESMPYSNEAEFWLDTYYPAQYKGHNNSKISGHETSKYFTALKDNPQIPLDNTLPWDTTYHAATFTVNMTFQAYLFAKPFDGNYSYHSFVIPFQAYEASWSATASYDITTDKWTKISDHIQTLTPINLPILEWPYLARGGIDPEWRFFNEDE